MNKQNFTHHPKKLSMKMSVEDIDQIGKKCIKEIKTIKIENSRLPNAKSPSTKRNLNLSPIPRRNSKIHCPSRKNSKDTISTYKEKLMTPFPNSNNISYDSINYGTKKENSDPSRVFNYQIVKKNKVLIPMTQKLNMSNLKLCQKHMLPNEKNYFISEKNFQLILEALNSKDIDIKNLRSLLEAANKDLVDHNDKFQNFIQMNEILRNQNKELTKENSTLKTNFDDLMFQVDKINIFFSKVIELVLYIVKTLYPNDKEILKKINELELNGIFSLDDNVGNSHKDAKENLKKILSSSYYKTEETCLEYKKKYYDAQGIIDQLIEIDSNKENLSEIAKDMLITKKRIQEVNKLNEKLEQENTYLRVSFQNLFCESENAKNSGKVIEEMNGKEKEEEKEKEKENNMTNQKWIKINEENEKKIKLLNDDVSLYKSEIANREDLYNELENKMKNAERQIEEKEKIISELKKQILTLNKSKLSNNNYNYYSYNNNNNNEENSQNSIYLNESKGVIYQQNFQYKKPLMSKISTFNEEKKNLEIKMLKEKINSLENEDKNLFFEGENDEIGVNGVQYIGDMFMILYNQSKMIENVIEQKERISIKENA